jgi:hypothetical protein
MASHSRRRSSIDRASVQSILTSGAEQPAADPPSPHVGDSPNRQHFSMEPPARPAGGHSRPLSYTPRRPNRLSLSFPVATGIAPYSNESTRPTPTSSNTQSFPATPADAPAVSPNDSTGFLVALASQERRVLELKEELQKAETDLIKLKRQWASHETHKKRAEIRHVEQLQPLQTVATDGSSPEEPTLATRHSIDLDKRKALLNNLNIPKESRRKFSGAHTRTLSLLSPERTNYAQPFPFPPVQESAENNGLSRTTTMPDTSQGITKINTNRARHSYQGGVTHNAKLIAEDVKAGLWTFLEDLRQATVGEEAVKGTTKRAGLEPVKGPARKSSKNSLRSNERSRRGQSPRGSPTPRTWDSLTGDNSSLLDAVDTTWPDVDKSRPATKALVPTKQKISRPLSLAAPAIDDLDDGWSNWDSPAPKSPRWSGSTTVSDDPPTPSNGSSDERAVKYFPLNSCLLVHC